MTFVNARANTVKLNTAGSYEKIYKSSLGNYT